MLAVFTVILCGPVKKLIEIRLDNTGITSLAQTMERKVKTGYREKRDIAPQVHYAVHQVPDAGFPLFLISVFAAILFLAERKNGVFQVPASHTPQVATTPLYLYIRKLQV